MTNHSRVYINYDEENIFFLVSQAQEFIQLRPFCWHFSVSKVAVTSSHLKQKDPYSPIQISICCNMKLIFRRWLRTMFFMLWFSFSPFHTFNWISRFQVYLFPGIPFCTFKLFSAFFYCFIMQIFDWMCHFNIFWICCFITKAFT